jgi:hypothetical protein
MKKFLATTALALATAGSVTFAAAQLISKDEVNAKVASLLAPFNDQVTRVNLAFTDLNIDSEKTLDFGLLGSVWKIGPKNELNLDLKSFEYHYLPSPHGAFSGSLGLDLIKLLGQEEFDSMADGLAGVVTEAAKDAVTEYGDAVTIKAAVEELNKDAEGHALNARMHFEAVIDLSKLPASVKIEDVEVKNLKIVASISRTNIALDAAFDLNPEYKGFKADQDGLKGFIEKLLADDAETYEAVVGVIRVLNDFAASAVGAKSSEISEGF